MIALYVILASQSESPHLTHWLTASVAAKQAILPAANVIRMIHVLQLSCAAALWLGPSCLQVSWTQAFQARDGREAGWAGCQCRLHG